MSARFATIALLVSLSACSLSVPAVPTQVRTTDMRSTEGFKPGPTLITTPQVERAFQAQKDLLNSREIGELVDKGLVREIVVDPTTIPVSLEVNVKGGTTTGLVLQSMLKPGFPGSTRASPYG